MMKNKIFKMHIIYFLEYLSKNGPAIIGTIKVGNVLVNIYAEYNAAECVS